MEMMPAERIDQAGDGRDRRNRHRFSSIKPGPNDSVAERWRPAFSHDLGGQFHVNTL